MAPAFPDVMARGLGVGLDLRWGDPAGFVVGPAGEDRVAPALRSFLTGGASSWGHAFFSWQPRDRARLRLSDYQPAWDELRACVPPGRPVGLHHTALDLASFDGPPSVALLDFTNALCEQYGLAWINEDVGFWSVGGRPVPYPLPPVLEADGLAACVRNARAAQRALARPLVLEFPGFSDGVPVLGPWDAYDFFRRLAEETDAPVTLDVAHLLSWRWRRGLRGEALYDDLERLPLAHAFEVHMSGCEIVRGPAPDGAADRFVDAHHGRLLEEQLVLLERLQKLCPNLRAVTFEDPRLNAFGALDSGSAASLARLRDVVDAWTKEGEGEEVPPRVEPPHPRRRPGVLTGSGSLPLALRHGATPSPPLAALGLAGPPRSLEALVAPSLVGLVRDRVQRGTGRLSDAFPRCIAGWCAAHPEDDALGDLFTRFVASPHTAAWREQPGLVGGACLEACFAAFAADEGLADALVIEEELLSVVLRALTVSPDPAFDPPPGVQGDPDGWFAISSAEPRILHAALQRRYLTGPVTPALAAQLDATPRSSRSPLETDR